MALPAERFGDEHVDSAGVLHGDLNRQEWLDAVRDGSCKRLLILQRIHEPRHRPVVVDTDDYVPAGGVPHSGQRPHDLRHRRQITLEIKTRSLVGVKKLLDISHDNIL